MEEPALIVLAKAGNLRSMLGGDAPVAASSSSDSVVAVPPVPSAPAGGGGKRTQGQMKTVNRKGLPLCDGFQKGTCWQANKTNNRCSHDSTKMHQCAICLEAGHGAHAREPNKNKGNGEWNSWKKGGRKRR